MIISLVIYLLISISVAVVSSVEHFDKADREGNIYLSISNPEVRYPEHPKQR